MTNYPILTARVPDLITSISHLRTQSTELCICYYLYNTKILDTITFSSQQKSVLVLQPRKLFKNIITTAANQLLLIHNHPSNACYPSRADMHATEVLTEMGGLFEYQLLDHIIVTKNEYFSFEEAGLIETQQSGQTKNQYA